jgi:transcription termination factor Rho
VSDQLTLEGVALDKKDKSELQSIVTALGGKPSARARKSDLIQQILDLSGVTAAAAAPAAEPGDAESPAGASAVESTDTEPGRAERPRDERPDGPRGGSERRPGPEAAAGGPRREATGGDRTERGAEPVRRGESGRGESGRGESGRGESGRGESGRGGGGRNESGRNESGRGEPGRGGAGRGDDARSGEPRRPDARSEDPRRDDTRTDDDRADAQERGGRPDGGEDAGRVDDESGGRRRRRRGRDRDRDRDREESQADPVPTEGRLDLRDEGYGFLRVAGYLPSRDDVYVSVKQVRQYGLRRGDIVSGLCRPAARNEKNPALHQVDAVNGRDPEDLRERPRFEDLTPLFPDERLKLETRQDPRNMTARIIDLVAPIGKGQRGLIVSPPKAGKTTVMKQIARAIELNNPEVELIVLLVDERPEEVTDMRRWLERGTVVASTFDRPPEEHCAVAELTIERAKRLVEEGRDVCVILDGITRLARAYNLAAPGTGRIMSGGVDSGALYAPKKFFGAARNLEEGGSLTILATALVETGSKMDEVIFEEFKGTGNMELRLDRRLAEKRIFPAIDVTASSTRHEELLFERRQVNLVHKMRRVLTGVGGDEAHSGAATELLIDRLATFRSNDEFLDEIAKAPGL